MVAIVDLKEAVLSRLAKGDISAEMVGILRIGEGAFIERESELWDYKAGLGSTKLDQAELVRDILAFHNSFGGYLLYGIADDGTLCGCESLDEQSVRQWVRTYALVDVQVAVATHVVGDASVTLVYIPKRARIDVPVAISRLGPDVPTKKTSFFKPGDIFFRTNDSSQLLRGSDDLRFLMGERRHASEVGSRSLGITITQNNLPDRSIIFGKFFGREEVKEDLWNWLADQMSRYRVLAGPGGVGKTSAAYSFCEEICIESPLGLDQVVWLSAKRNQFSAARNEGVPLPYKPESRLFGEAYSSFDTLLDALSYHFAISDDEWDGIERHMKMRRLIDSFSVLRSLVVVDDLDSLSPDDQRMAVEFAMSIGSGKSRFLFTTRKNYLAPLSSTTELRGLKDDDFRNFASYLEGVYGRTLQPSELKALERDTRGSPLFVESIFRLLKLGERFGDALTRWKEADGEAVRAASFRKELEQLSWTAKRVLYAMSMFESVSLVEVRKMTELEATELEAAVTELDRLFLIQSREIGKDARFEVAPNLKRLLQELKVDLVPNHTEINRRATTLRSEVKTTGHARGKNKEIAAAIQQAMAHLTEGGAVDACVTIKSVLETHKKSADLWMVYARCLTAVEPLDGAGVRHAFQESFRNGKREPQLFSKWIDFELQYGNSNAAIDVAEKGNAVFGESVNAHEWLAKRAAAHLKRGLEREVRREYTDAMGDLKQAASLISKGIRKAPTAARPSIIPFAQRVNDSIWSLANQPGQFSVDERYDIARSAVDTGDRRVVCLLRLIDIIDAAMHEPGLRFRNPAKLREWIGDASRRAQLCKAPIVYERLERLTKAPLVEGRHLDLHDSSHRLAVKGYYDLKRSGDQYMFNLKAGNHEVILTSERYVTKASAQNGIASVRQNSSLDERYQRKTATNGLPYFTLTAPNGQAIGRSEMYSSITARESGIVSVKANGPSTVVKDNT